ARTNRSASGGVHTSTDSAVIAPCARKLNAACWRTQRSSKTPVGSPSITTGLSGSSSAVSNASSAAGSRSALAIILIGGERRFDGEASIGQRNGVVWHPTRCRDRIGRRLPAGTLNVLISLTPARG